MAIYCDSRQFLSNTFMCKLEVCDAMETSPDGKHEQRAQFWYGNVKKRSNLEDHWGTGKSALRAFVAMVELQMKLPPVIAVMVRMHTQLPHNQIQ